MKRIVVLDLPLPPAESLAEAVGAPLAAELRRAMLRDVAELAAGIDEATASVRSAEADACARIRVEAAPPAAPIEEAAEAAFAEAFRAEAASEGESGVVLLASDAPTFPETYLWGALDMLSEHSLVISPAEDAGFVLVGLSRPAPGLFAGLPWGEPGLFAELMRRAAEAKLSAGLLPPWYRVVGARSLGLLRGHLAALRAEGGKRLPERTAIFIDGAFG